MLQGIVSYSDSDDNGEDIKNNTISKRSNENNCNELSNKQKKIEDNNETESYDESENESEDEDFEDKSIKKKNKRKFILPLPSSINKLYSGCKEGSMGNKTASTKHQGRKRTFDHVEGNWATFIFFPPIENNNLFTLCEKVYLVLKQNKQTSKLHFIPLKDCHLTISRTVPVRHYWIDTIFTMLKEKFGIKKKFFYSITGLEVYTNDDGSRTFISLKIDTNQTLLDSVAMVDDIFREFDLPIYYKNPSFHISIAWCIGNHKDMLSESINADIIKELFSNFQGQLDLNLITKVCVKFGNKLQQVELM